MSRSLLILIIFVLGAGITISQNIITYTYDRAGNRIMRVQDGSTDFVMSRSITDSIVNSDGLISPNISVSPNPTSGLFRVELSGFSQAVNPQISIYSVSGSKIGSTKNGHFSEFDISTCPSGIYIITVELDGKQQFVKLIKN